VTRRAKFPLYLLAILAALTAAFAALALSMAPSNSSLSVQNATAATFGYPSGTNSFSMDLTSTVSAGPGTGSISQTRLINYEPPANMVVYRTGPTLSKLGTLDQAAIDSAIAGYVAIVGGPTPWVSRGQTFNRSETLMDFVARVRPQSTAPSTTATGTVTETAIVRDGLLVYVNLNAVVPRQKIAGGAVTTGGVEGETFRLLTISGHPAPALTP